MINADSAGPWTSLRWGINSVTGCAALNFSEKGYRRPSTVTDRQCAIQATRVSAHGGRGRAQWQCQPFGRQRQKSAQIKDHQTESIVEGIAVENLASESLISPSRHDFCEIRSPPDFPNRQPKNSKSRAARLRTLLPRRYLQTSAFSAALSSKHLHFPISDPNIGTAALEATWKIEFRVAIHSRFAIMIILSNV